MEVINLEQKLTLEQQVAAFNENVLGYYGQEYNVDFKYLFTIGESMLQVIQKEKGEWWGSINDMSHYAMGQCIDLGYLPIKLVYLGMKRENTDDKGIHQFIIDCQDKRRDRLVEGHNCDGKNNDCSECYKRRNKQ